MSRAQPIVSGGVARVARVKEALATPPPPIASHPTLVTPSPPPHEEALAPIHVTPLPKLPQAPTAIVTHPLSTQARDPTFCSLNDCPRISSGSPHCAYHWRRAVRGLPSRAFLSRAFLSRVSQGGCLPRCEWGMERVERTLAARTNQPVNQQKGGVE
jgi:hypothetical protein